MTNTIETTDMPCDPFFLLNDLEAIATATELRALLGGPTDAKLRHFRRHRLVRYIDRHPDLPPNTGPTDRYAYCVADVQALRRPRAIEETAATAPPPPPAPRPPPPSPIPRPLPPAARARLHGPAPEIVYARPRLSPPAQAVQAPPSRPFASRPPDRRREVADVFASARRQGG